MINVYYFILFLLARPSQDVFLLPHIPLIEHGGIMLLFMWLYDLFDGLSILSEMGGVSTVLSAS